MESRTIYSVIMWMGLRRAIASRSMSQGCTPLSVGESHYQRAPQWPERALIDTNCKSVSSTLLKQKDNL